ncbi:hypothetical protein [Legionella resiliens]|uniref:Dot/Icm T4SS effector n=1 Tax=Legionella resiliens TaxID=2905958 RepID=A0ABS8X1C4_9GAMM|nr:MULTISPECIES: hypothetical protein [unclassified Legionella]MCE0721739.1 hypothetical protein [Legionella sp. 9fVS26]MCE3530893.1 hypothetical protein [Legionella sp. 8cVS16]
MRSKANVTKELPVSKRSKLEPPYDAGDCGYYAVCVCLLYLGMQAKTDKALAATINNSKVLTTIFSHMPLLSRMTGSNNMETIENIFIGLNASGWDRISFREVLNEFSNGIRRSLVTSDWGLDYFNKTIHEGAWVFDNQKWMDLPPFKRLNEKILDKMLMLSNGKDVTADEAGALRFQATVEIFKELNEETLKSMSKAVIEKYYGPGSEKAWLDAEFLKYFSKQLFPGSDNLFFDPKRIQITSDGPSQIHWYVDVPNGEISDSLLKTVNSGPSKDLKEIEVYRVKDSNLDDLSPLIQEHEDLLKAQQQLIMKFKEIASGLYAKYLDSSFPEEVLIGLSGLSCFEKEPPLQATIDEVLMPIVAASEDNLSDYTNLCMTQKSIVALNEKIKKVEKEIESRKDKISTSSLISSSLSFQSSKEKPATHDKSEVLDDFEMNKNKSLPT